MMQKSFRHYLEESAKEYHYRIKTVVPVDEERLAALENVLEKYNIIDMGEVKKTMMQAHPLDFYDVDNKEVYILDVVTGLPVSAYILQQELRKALNIPEKYIVVRTDNDPLEVQGQQLAARQEMEATADEEGWQREAMLSTEEYYHEHERGEDGSNYYGDEYNQNLTTYLAQVATEREPEHYDAPDPLFSWLDMPEEKPFQGPENDFNADFDAPKPVESWNVDPDQDLNFKFYDMYTGQYGNFDDDHKTWKRSYKDPKTGKRHVVKQVSNSISDEGEQ